MAKDKAPGNPDIRQLRDEKLAEGRFPGDAAQDFRVFIDPKVHEEIARHAKDDTSVEVCGVLVGKLQRDENGPFVLVTASIRGDAAASKEAEVTFTHATWAKINEKMDKEYRDLAIVGWYHTHPNFGIFLSDRDRFIHEHFFGGPGQIAYVVDPVRKLEGVFVWREGEPVIQPYYSIGPRLYLSDDTEGTPRREMAKSSAPAALAATPPSERSGESVSTFYLWTTQLLFLICGLAIGFLLLRSNQSAVIAEHMREVHAAVIKDTRLGLAEALEEAEQRIADNHNDLRLLHDNTKASEELKAEAVRQKWNEVFRRNDELFRFVRAIDANYSLTVEERAAIERAKTPPPTTRPATQASATTQPSAVTRPAGN
jgi:proteasome lid subunit RPN8/RPN11